MSKLVRPVSVLLRKSVLEFLFNKELGLMMRMEVLMAYDVVLDKL